ncbi:MAG: thioesterase domain-containing protein [Jatrophihabitantaceae bacterium]
MTAVLRDASGWLQPQRPLSAELLTLFCFSYAGGSPSAFRGWQAELPGVQVVPILLPGRCTRLTEQPCAESAIAVGEISAAIAASMEAGHCDRYAMFGHSMGALLAYQTAVQLRRGGRRRPAHLFVSASRPPHQYGQQARHQWSDDELRSLVRELGGQTAQGPLADEFLQRRLPALRADLSICDTYRWRPEPPLDCPMTAFAGTADPIANPEQVLGWREYTSRSFVARTVEDDHFFLLARNGREQLLAQLKNELCEPDESIQVPCYGTSTNGTGA